MPTYRGIYISDSDYEGIARYHSRSISGLSQPDFIRKIFDKLIEQRDRCERVPFIDFFTDFINRETHYEIVRDRRHPWNGKQNRFEGLTNEEYMKYRRSRLHIFAEHAIKVLNGKRRFMMSPL